MKRYIPAPYPVLSTALFGLATLLTTWATGGLSPSLLNPDEGAHYVNALFLGDWLRAGLPSPLPFARDFYAHFPRLSIGHWPPGWYMLQAPLFAAWRPAAVEALALSAFVAGLPAGLILWAFGRSGRPRLGATVALAYILSPLVVDAGRHILLDQPVALVVGLAAIAWFHASREPSLRRLLLFGVVAAAAPLVKGNGALVALVPAIDVALTRRWAMLRVPALWVAAAVAALIVGPWYWLSFRISAGGFNFEPGPAYAWAALRANLAALLENVGVAGVALAAGGAVAAILAGGERARLAKLALSVVIATLAFQSAVPVALEPRYIAPLLPWIYVLGGLGLAVAFERRRGRLVAAAAGALALIPAAVNLWSLPPKPDIGAPILARTITGSGGIWLVDARAGGEGAVIAAVAHADGGRRRVWIARASQWLSTSDFMGRGYRLTAADPAAADAVLDRLGVAGVVSIAERHRPAYPHSVVLNRAIRSGGYLVATRRFPVGAGATTVATRVGGATPHPELLAAGAGSANVGKLGSALD